jgi:hypothetical protein
MILSAVVLLMYMNVRAFMGTAVMSEEVCVEGSADLAEGAYSRMPTRLLL